MTCDSNRPCARCVKRNIGHLCHDEVKDKYRENGTESTSQSPALEPSSPEQMSHIDPEIKTGSESRIYDSKFKEAAVANTSNPPNPPKSRPHPTPPPLQPTSNETFDFLNLSWQSYPYLQAPYTFASDVIGNEFSVLNDFMTLGDDLHEPSFESSLNDPIGGLIQGTGYNNESSFGNPTNGNSLMPHHGPDGSVMFDPNQPVAPSPNPNGHNGGNRETDVAKEHYLLTAADPAGEVSPEERLKQVINAKVDAGILKPFNYVKGYARLQKYMEIQYLQF
jgi:hypothetical protein